MSYGMWLRMLDLNPLRMIYRIITKTCASASVIKSI